MKSLAMAFGILALAGTLVAQGQRAGRAARMDANGDGKISKEEWKGPANMFSRLDADNDGYITRDEMAKQRQNRLGPAARVGRNLGKMDANNDGKISVDEWKGTKEMFDRIDSNRDGYITRDEIRANRPARPNR